MIILNPEAESTIVVLSKQEKEDISKAIYTTMKVIVDLGPNASSADNILADRLERIHNNL